MRPGARVLIAAPGRKTVDVDGAASIASAAHDPSAHRENEGVGVAPRSGARRSRLRQRRRGLRRDRAEQNEPAPYGRGEGQPLAEPHGAGDGGEHAFQRHDQRRLGRRRVTLAEDRQRIAKSAGKEPREENRRRGARKVGGRRRLEGG